MKVVETNICGTGNGNADRHLVAKCESCVSCVAVSVALADRMRYTYNYMYINTTHMNMTRTHRYIMGTCEL